MRFLAIASSLAVIILAGVLHGDMSGRWGASQELQRAVDRLVGVPESIGEWQGSDFELDPQSVQIGEIAGYMARRYANAEGDRFTVMLVCGRPGPIAAHSPEWCYGGAGYHDEGAPAAETLELDGGGTASFFRSRFAKERAAVPERLEISWAWNAGRGWQAPENPRLAFAPDRYLYKLYVVRDVSSEGPGGRGEEDATRRRFMQELVPAIDAALFETSVM